MSNSNSDVKKQDEYLNSNISNMVNSSKYKHSSKFSSFFDERQCEIAGQQLKRLGYENYLFYGGYDDARRLMLGTFSQESQADTADFPLNIIEITFNKKYEISHRDCLGSLMALQIDRSCVGDIIIEEGKVLFIVESGICDFILLNLNKIGKLGVTPVMAKAQEIENHQEYEEIVGSVSSLRLDCIVALIISKSRTIASQTIMAGLVKVNYLDIENNSHMIKPNDAITIRGKGKFLVCGEIKLTKKNRYFIKINKLI